MPVPLLQNLTWSCACDFSTRQTLMYWSKSCRSSHIFSPVSSLTICAPNPFFFHMVSPSLHSPSRFSTIVSKFVFPGILCVTKQLAKSLKLFPLSSSMEKGAEKKPVPCLTCWYLPCDIILLPQKYLQIVSGLLRHPRSPSLSRNFAVSPLQLQFSPVTYSCLAK